MPDVQTDALLRDSLACGHGRVKRLFAQLPVAVSRQTLLDACLRSCVFDRQCEPSVVPWLYDWVRQLGIQREMRDAVAAELSSGTTADEDDQHQMIGLLPLAVLDGDTSARSLLDSLLARSNTDATLCDEELAKAVITLDGPAGFLQAARTAGLRLARHESRWGAAWHKVERLLESEQLDGISESDVDALLRPYRHEPNVAAVWERVQQHRGHVAERAIEKAQRRRERKERGLRRVMRTEYAATALQAELERRMRRIEDAGVDAWPLQPSMWRDADPESLWALVRWLSEEQRPEQVRHLLVAFRVVAPPIVPPRVFDLARDSSHERIQAAAIRLLSNVNKPTVRSLALELLAGDERAIAAQRGAIRLLQYDCRPADVELALRALDGLDVDSLDHDARHEIGCNICDVAELHDNAPELAPLLEWLYEHTPCKRCRCEAVKALLGYDALRPEWVEECRHDGDPSIRELVA